MSARVTTLANGFRVATDAMPGRESAEGGIWIRCGAAHDPEGMEGIAHFAEHMLFRGTKSRSAAEINEPMEALGGDFSACTENETTCVSFSALGEVVPQAVEACAEMIMEPLLDPEDAESEREVILHELRMEDDSFMERTLDLAMRTAYPDDSFGRPIGGTRESVAAIDGAAVAEFIRRSYVPGRMILSVAGAVDHDALAAQAEGLFGGMDGGSGDPLPKPRFAGGSASLAVPSNQVHLAVLAEGPSLADEPADMYAGMLYAMALGGTFSSRLHGAVRDDLGLCYDLAAWAQPSSRTGSIAVATATDPEDAPGLAQAVFSEIRRSADDFGADELDRMKTRLRAGLRMDMDSPSSRAERMARMLADMGRVPPIEETLASVGEVSLARIGDLIGKLVHESPMAFAMLGPMDDVPEPPSLESLLEFRG